jgi:hypothetical protein
MLPSVNVHRNPIRLVNHGPKKHVKVMKAYNKALAALTRSGLCDPPTPRPFMAFHIWFVLLAKISRKFTRRNMNLLQAHRTRKIRQSESGTKYSERTVCGPLLRDGLRHSPRKTLAMWSGVRLHSATLLWTVGSAEWTSFRLFVITSVSRKGSGVIKSLISLAICYSKAMILLTILG